MPMNMQKADEQRTTIKHRVILSGNTFVLSVLATVILGVAFNGGFCAVLFPYPPGVLMNDTSRAIELSRIFGSQVHCSLIIFILLLASGATAFVSGIRLVIKYFKHN